MQESGIRAASPRATAAATLEHSFRRTHFLLGYYLLTLLAVLVNMAGYLKNLEYAGRITPFYAAAVYVSYAVIYSLPLLLLLLLADLILRWLGGRLSSRRSEGVCRWMICLAAVFGFGLLQVLIYADRTIQEMYGFHLNGFVWNLVFTRGGIESLGNTPSATRSYVLMIASLFGIQAVLLLVAMKLARLRWLSAWLGSKKVLISAAILFVLVGAFQQITFGVAHVKGYAPVLAAANGFPLYIHLTFTRLAESMGVKVSREPGFTVQVGGFQLAYPLQPIKRKPVAAPPNIVWLVSESLRYDMVDPEIMPTTWDFAQKAVWFREHYSGGNGTRMAMFSMFYGMYGTYWFPFLDERRGPVLMDELIAQNYQMQMYTSAKFSYPEFDATIFAKLPAECLHEGTAQPKWRRDRENIDALLDFISRRDTARPFMTFMFFESPHATYYFPKENVIRTPYAQDINYATMDVHKDITAIKNRYINACNHLDSQIARILTYLTANRLLESTVVLITGDHGEEFMENGRWGHNSTFDEWQTRPPLVLWVPGQQPRQVTRITSHMDIPATLMPLLGVTNPPEDYSQGYDLFSEQTRLYTVICDWNVVAYVNENYKVVFPTAAYGFQQYKITTRQDQPVIDRSAFYDQERAQLAEVMKGMTRFSK